jgi:hypothetical protein
MVVPTGLVQHRAMLKKQLLTAAAVAAFGIATGASLAGSPATASAASWNHHRDYLKFPPPRGYRKCVSRRIFFAPGRYRWRLFEAQSGHPGDTESSTSSVRVLRGWHRWSDCLDRFERISGPPRFIYRHRSYLDNTAHPGGPVKRVDWGLQFLGERYGIGTYHWGSTLQHLVRRPR